ncbi:MAG: secreted trypsin-like lysyl endopeptidase, Por secretion system C-terminal sorting domain protein [Bacteroidetes bacterium]|nr:secreted trypsin-like lysyl endopeptidase, Por secretion system C-terminal sorting domain protein [Bacteroidota bacterium]
MKLAKMITIVGMVLTMINSTNAQISLPYYTGFDNVPGQAGWVEIKKGATTFSHWGMANYGACSEPNYLNHSYSPSSGITLTDNWYVSPEFFIPSGGHLDSIRYMFSGFSTPEADDTIGIYLLQGSEDPGQAVSKILLYDFRGDNYPVDGTFHLLSNLNLQSFSGSSFIAIRYRNSDCSSKWITVGFDNIAISSNSLSVDDHEKGENLIHIYPNPAVNRIQIETNTNTIKKVELFNLIGQSLLVTNFYDQIQIDLSSYPSGTYFVKIENEGEVITRKLIKQ